MPPRQRVTVHPNQIHPPALVLSGDQVHYLRRVLRLQPKDTFIAQDGEGHQWLAELTAVDDQAILVETITQTDAPKGLGLTLVAALPKAGFDDVVRQVTEIGVTHIQPLLSQRTLLRPSDNKLKRWQRIAQEASEQSERLWVPTIQAPLSFETWVRGNTPLVGNTDKASFFCVARGDAPLLLADIQGLLATRPTLPVSVAVGPEGGWTPEEIAEAQTQGHTLVSLGSAVLRATTAALVAIAVVAAARNS
ncbi:MAG: 16S rRNA (uracil(1498)-N(3))-methyltransferase [Cyanobacteria bacterium P01_G01_bin.38]